MLKNHSFTEKVLLVVEAIPAGNVMTYGDVAAAAGSPGAARAVGSLMRQNYLPHIPCHRVVRSDGTVGMYNRTGGEAKKQAKLEAEGVDCEKLLQCRMKQ